jgi:hypothetical protein
VDAGFPNSAAFRRQGAGCLAFGSLDDMLAARDDLARRAEAAG